MPNISLPIYLPKNVFVNLQSDFIAFCCLELTFLAAIDSRAWANSTDTPECQDGTAYLLNLPTFEWMLITQKYFVPINGNFVQSVAFFISSSMTEKYRKVIAFNLTRAYCDIIYYMKKNKPQQPDHYHYGFPQSSNEEERQTKTNKSIWMKTLFNMIQQRKAAHNNYTLSLSIANRCGFRISCIFGPYNSSINNNAIVHMRTQPSIAMASWAWLRTDNTISFQVMHSKWRINIFSPYLR